MKFMQPSFLNQTRDALENLPVTRLQVETTAENNNK